MNTLSRERLIDQIALADGEIASLRKNVILTLVLPVILVLLVAFGFVTGVWEPARAGLFATFALLAMRQPWATMMLREAQGNRPSKRECMASHPSNRGNSRAQWTLLRKRRGEWRDANLMNARLVPLIGWPVVALAAIPVMVWHDALGTLVDLGIVTLIAAIWAFIETRATRREGATNPIPGLEEAVHEVA